MDCERAIELLPWYLNSTLETAERAEVEAHLAGCGRCRTELRDARAAFTLFGGHVPAPMLVDYAFGRPAVASDLIEAHLAGCAACAAELVLARASAAELRASATAAGEIVPVSRSRRASPALLRAAAVVTAVVGLAGAIWSWQQLDRQQQARQRIATLEAEVRALGGGAETARLNVPIHDLWPESLVLRGTAGTEVELPAAAGPPATLILNSELGPGEQVARLELRDEAGRLLERLDGPNAGAAGSFTLSLALDRLPPGRLQILLYAADASEPLEVYTFDLRQP